MPLLPTQDDFPIYKSLYGLKGLKKQIKISPMKKKTIDSNLKQYKSAIEEAKKYRAKAPKDSNTKDLFKAGATASLTPLSYTSPNVYTNKNEWDNVIKELTACKKYLESELKQCESFSKYESANIYKSLFDFELE